MEELRTVRTKQPPDAFLAKERPFQRAPAADAVQASPEGKGGGAVGRRGRSRAVIDGEGANE